MARHRRRGALPPWAAMPAELQDFDPKEWALEGETPDADAWRSGDWSSTWDYHHCHRRYTSAMTAWFDAHPEASFLEWINTKRARRIAQP